MRNAHGRAANGTHLHRPSFTKQERLDLLGPTDKKGFYRNCHDNKTLRPEETDLGHRYGYENKALIRCAERYGMTQKDFNKMVKDPKIYQQESKKDNRSGKFECKDTKLQDQKCTELINKYYEKVRAENQSKTQSSSRGRSVSFKGSAKSVSQSTSQARSRSSPGRSTAQSSVSRTASRSTGGHSSGSRSTGHSSSAGHSTSSGGHSSGGHSSGGHGR